jgi:bifunctional non-homologous end joining protein LigD
MAKRPGKNVAAAGKPEMPGFIPPQLATLRSKAPSGDWLHEIKYDGYRIQLHLNKGKRKVYTRNGLDWTSRFSAIAGAFEISGQAIIDGEAVVIREGRTNFSELQAELAAGRQDRIRFYAFDLLYLDGSDLRKTPQIERKQLLKTLFEKHTLASPVLYSEHLIGDGQKIFEHAAALNYEGIVSKRADAPYRSERTEAWLKIKAVQKGKFPVIGFDKDPTGVAALYLGKREGNDLVYMGKVGTGWSRTVSSQIRKQLDSVVSPKSKLTKPVRMSKATWVEPRLSPTWNSATSPPRACCGSRRSRASQGSEACLTARPDRAHPRNRRAPARSRFPAPRSHPETLRLQLRIAGSSR